MPGDEKMKIMIRYILVMVLLGCSADDRKDEVIVYTSVDQHYSEAVFEQFEQSTGIKVRAVYDVEANKTTGLVNRLLSEKETPKADVFWNGEYSQTLLLAAQGLLTPYRSPRSEHAIWQDENNLWFAFGGRARVFIINIEAIGDNPYPTSIFDLLSDQWPADKTAIAMPLFGTTATHAAALWALLGESRASSFFSDLNKRGVNLLDGNSVVRDKVASGELWFGLTDSDDACGAAARGAPIVIRFPDQKEGALGTLIIPNTLALITNGPNKKNGQRLIDFLLSENIQTQLAISGWFHIEGKSVSTQNDCPLPETIQVMDVSPDDVYAQLQVTNPFLRDLILR